MKELRKKINQVDSEILKLLAKRRDLSKKIVELKNQTSLRDENREKEMLKQLVELGKKEDLNQELVLKIFKEIIDDSVKLQSEILNKKSKK